MSDEKEHLIDVPAVFGEGGNLLLERELGQGGMGGVYMGRDKMLDRPVAVKVMLKEYGADEAFVSRFKAEARAAAKLIHPNIAQVYSYGISDGMPYIAMELVAGGSLEQVMKVSGSQSDIPRVLKICEQVAQALRCAADQGLVHGDIKPENVLLDANGNAKLVDFGLAGMQKDVDEIWGTPYYIAPEKLKKGTPIDYRADMYNLGGTLYHALTGVPPFDGPDVTEVVRARFNGKPKAPSEVRKEIPKAVDKLVLKMLAVDPKDRYPTFEALLEAFKDVMSKGLVDASAASPGKAKPTVGGTKRMALKRPGRKMMKMKLGNATGAISVAPGADGAAGADGDGEDAPTDENGEQPVTTGKFKKPSLSNGSDVDEEEEEGGNIGKKVVISVVGGIGAIGLIIGGLVWYQIADKRSRANEKIAMITKNVASAREAIATTRKEAEKWLTKVETLSAQAVSSCERFTKQFEEKVPEFADRFKPAPTKELLDAIALTNQPVVVESATNTVAAVTNAMAAAATAALAAPAPAAKAAAPAAPQGPRFRPPTDDEADPASPEHEAYVKAKKEWEEAQKNKPAEPPKEEPKPAVEEKKSEPAEEGADAKNPLAKEFARIGNEAVKNMNELWERAYACQAAAIRIHYGITKTLNECDKADKMEGDTEENMKALGALSGVVLDMYNETKGSKDVETIQKGVGYIKTRGEKSVIAVANDLFRAKAEDDRRIKREKEEAERVARLKKADEDRLALVESEKQEAATKFTVIQSSNALNLLSWDASLRQIDFMDSNFKTAEGHAAAKEERLKISDMKAVQDILIKNMKGYKFRKAKLGKEKAVVKDVNATEISLAKPVANSNKQIPFKITWVKFYKEYHGNLNELFLQYIDNGRKNCKPALTLKQWSEAMCGAALTLHIVCAEDATSAERATQMIKEVGKQNNDYLPTLKKMFPNEQLDGLEDSIE